MRTRRSFQSVGALALALVFFYAPAVLAADSEPDKLTLILDELRQLRRSVELTALVQVKVQVASERLKLHEPQARALAERAAHAEQAQTATAVELERTQAELARLDERLAQDTTADAQRELLAQRRALTDSFSRMSRQEDEARRQAEALTASLTAERSELERLTATLGELEQSLERHVRAQGPKEPSAP